MLQDQYGQFVYSEKDLCDLLLSNPELTLSKFITEKKINFNSELELQTIPNLIEYVPQNNSIEEFDLLNQAKWHMPQEYVDLDIAQWLLDQCNTDAERQRVGQELLLYLERNLFTLLQYLKYLVDVMRQHNVVWGVGRGSSVSSYVLFLLGVHKINSLYYDLDITEFLK
jgi:DNA polymerase III alpha subunit